jgi:hypothetical protein
MGIYDADNFFSGVNFFYHCMPDDTENGITAFHVGDRVMVATVDGNANTRYIIGFEDLLPRTCEFYLKLTFNGFIPAKGGEAITVKNENYSEAKIVEPGGLCGPFTGKVGTGEETISLAVGSTVYGTGYFAHYVEAPIGEANIHFRYKFVDVTPVGWPQTLYKFVVERVVVWPPTPPPVDTILHVKMVLQAVHLGLLYGCVKTTELVGGKVVSVYLVNFVDLCILSQDRIDKLMPNYNIDCLLDCGMTSISPTVSAHKDKREIESIPSAYGSGIGWCCGDLRCPVIPNVTDTSLVRVIDHVVPFTLPPNQFCILSNADGQFPVYTTLSIGTNYYLKQCIKYCSSSPYTELSRIENTDYLDCREFKWEMVPTPASKF